MARELRWDTHRAKSCSVDNSILAAWPTIDVYRRMEAHPSRQEGGNPRRSDAGPLVSIVTVTRNAERLLPQTMASVAAQTYPNIEYIVVDAASSDGTVGLLRRNDVVTRWISEPDAGIYDGMNKGIAIASGVLVKLLNADDLLPPDSVERAVAAYKSTPPGTCVYGDVAVMNHAGETYGRLTLDGAIRFFPIFLHPAWYLPLAVYERHGLYLTRFRVASDYEYSLRLRRAGVRFHHLGGEPVVTFRTEGASSSFTGVREGFLINREYQGLGPAVYVALMQAYKKGRSKLAQEILGERAAHQLRAVLHRARAARRE